MKKIISSIVFVSFDEKMKAGYYADAINLNKLSNGIYWLILKSGNETKTKKLILVK